MKKAELIAKIKIEHPDLIKIDFSFFTVHELLRLINRFDRKGKQELKKIVKSN